MTNQVVPAVRANRSRDAVIVAAVIAVMALPCVLLGPHVAAWAMEWVTIPNVAAVMGPVAWALTITVYLLVAISWMNDHRGLPPSAPVKIRRRLASASG